VRHLQDGVAVEFISPVVEVAWSEAFKGKA
jgi:hypothetical protein